MTPECAQRLARCRPTAHKMFGAQKLPLKLGCLLLDNDSLTDRLVTGELITDSLRQFDTPHSLAFIGVHRGSRLET